MCFAVRQQDQYPEIIAADAGVTGRKSFYYRDWYKWVELCKNF